jgi:hypothetical protein
MLGQLKTGWSISGALHHESFCREPPTQRGHHPLLVINQQHVHTPSIGCERRKIARRRTEEERAKAFFPSRATTTAAESKRDARAAARSRLESSEASGSIGHTTSGFSQ